MFIGLYYRCMLNKSNLDIECFPSLGHEFLLSEGHLFPCIDILLFNMKNTSN